MTKRVSAVLCVLAMMFMLGLPGVRAQDGFCYGGWEAGVSYWYGVGNDCRQVNTFNCPQTGEEVEETTICAQLADDDVAVARPRIEIGEQTIKNVLRKDRNLAMILACHNKRFIEGTTYRAKISRETGWYEVTTSLNGTHIRIASSWGELLLTIDKRQDQEHIRWPGQ